MKKNLLKSVFILLLYLSGSGLIQAQSLTNLEKQYEQLNIKLEKENMLLDSLKNIFSYKTSLIDVEKEKKNPDNDEIIELMAGSVATSNKMEEQNKKIKRFEKEIEDVKHSLHELYITKIDSLELLKKTGKADENKIDAEILMLTEKNILVAPRILSLSFNPEKILAINLENAKDAKTKKLYMEYLNNALSEVNGLLQNVNEQISEVNQIVALQTKTRKFLEDAELEGKIIIQSQQNETLESTDAARVDAGVTTASSDFAANIENYQIILRQLDIHQLSKTDLKYKISFEELDRNLNIKEYQKLLKEVKERLQEFKLVLANKIGSSK